MHQTSTLIIKETPHTWTLRFATSVGTDQELVTRFVFKTLMKALEAARVLKVHVDNNHKLPLKQYNDVV